MPKANSYDSQAVLPTVGSRWVWELEKPYARELIEVVEVFWNGEEWWVRTQSLRGSGWIWGGVFGSATTLNDLGRFWEAVTPVGGSMKGLTERRSADPAEA